MLLASVRNNLASHPSHSTPCSLLYPLAASLHSDPRPPHGPPAARPPVPAGLPQPARTPPSSPPPPALLTHKPRTVELQRCTRCAASVRPRPPGRCWRTAPGASARAAGCSIRSLPARSPPPQVQQRCAAPLAPAGRSCHQQLRVYQTAALRRTCTCAAVVSLRHTAALAQPVGVCVAEGSRCAVCRCDAHAYYIAADQLSCGKVAGGS